MTTHHHHAPGSCRRESGRRAMIRYSIAGFMTDEQRERAVMADYALGPEGIRTSGGAVCPLGVAFCLGYSPDATEVAEILEEAGGYEHDAAWEAAEIFIEAVDTGLIGPTDVAAALGVDQPAAEIQGEE